MSTISKYLQEHLNGEVVISNPVRDHFARDASILTLRPEVVVFPANRNDIRKAARFSWQLSEKGHLMPLNVRGAGQGQTGAALGKGVVLSLETHFNEVYEFDAKQGLARMQPGALISDIQKILKTYGFRVPTGETVGSIGGIIASNYEDAIEWVSQLEVVLANGEVIQTSALNKRELNRKKGLATLEGEIYRAVDGALNENPEAVSALNLHGGYGAGLSDVAIDKGAFDLTPLFIGSQGTLGIISEMIVKVEPISGDGTMIVAHVDTSEDLEQILPEIEKAGATSIDFIDGAALSHASSAHGFDFSSLLGDAATPPLIILLIRFDGDSKRKEDKRASRLSKTLLNHGIQSKLNADDDERDRWEYLLKAAVNSGTYADTKPSIPLRLDVTLPTGQFSGFWNEYAKYVHEHRIESIISGTMFEEGMVLQVVPRFEPARLADRAKIFDFIEQVGGLVARLGGSLGNQYGEGRLYAPAVNSLRTVAEKDLLAVIKTACDPHNYLGRGVIFGDDIKTVAPLLNSEYSLRLQGDRLPS